METGAAGHVKGILQTNWEVFEGTEVTGGAYEGFAPEMLWRRGRGCPFVCGACDKQVGRQPYDQKSKGVCRGGVPIGDRAVQSRCGVKS